MKVSKPLAYCLSFSWASCLVDFYAAYQAEYWSMLSATIGVRLLMTGIALGWCVYMHRSRRSENNLGKNSEPLSWEAIPLGRSGSCVPLSQPIESAGAFASEDSTAEVGDISETPQPVMN